MKNNKNQKAAAPKPHFKLDVDFTAFEKLKQKMGASDVEYQTKYAKTSKEEGKVLCSKKQK